MRKRQHRLCASGHPYPEGFLYFGSPYPNPNNAFEKSFFIIPKRTEIATTIVTSNFVRSKWGRVFDTVTDSAILDRLGMNGRFITFEGRPYSSIEVKDI